MQLPKKCKVATANFATEHGQRSRCTWQHYHEASGMSDVGSSRCVFSFWKVWKPRAVCVARDPRNYKPHVSLRAFRRTRVIWFVARPQKRRTISGGEACVYLDQALFCEWNVTRLCMRDGGMSQVCLKPASSIDKFCSLVLIAFSSYPDISRESPLSPVVARPYAELGGVLWR